MNVNMEEGWTEVTHRKKEEILKQHETEDEKIYVLSSLIHNEACIHCMVGKCRERSKDHSPIYFPDQIMGYIRNPLAIKTLDETLKRHPIEVDILKPYQLRYSVCMFNHCRKGCKNCHANRFSSIDIGDDTILYFCYPPLDKLMKNIVTLGLHIDIQLTQMGSRYEMNWRTKHNEIVDDIETSSAQSLRLSVMKPSDSSATPFGRWLSPLGCAFSPMSSNSSPMMENRNKWSSIVKKNLTEEEQESFAMKDEESSKYMVDTEDAQRRVMHSPRERNQSYPMQNDRRRPPPRRNTDFEDECMYRFDVLLKEIQSIKEQNHELQEKVISLHTKISSLEAGISVSNEESSSSPKKFITW